MFPQPVRARARTASLALAVALSAASPQETEPGQVPVYVVAQDKNGRLVVGLSRDDFRVIDDKKEQPVFDFARAAAQPTYLGVLVDTSGSARTEPAQWLAKYGPDFLQTVWKDKGAAFIAAFGDNVSLHTEQTADLSLLELGLKRVSAVKPRGTTKLFDVLAWASETRLAKATGRRVLIVVTDGGENQSRTKEKELRRIVDQANVVIYFLFYVAPFGSYNIPPEELGGLSLVRGIAEDTGGFTFGVTRETDFQEALNRIASELQASYVLGFVPPNTLRDGRFRKLKVEVTLPGVMVRARRGYYAANK